MLSLQSGFPLISEVPTGSLEDQDTNIRTKRREQQHLGASVSSSGRNWTAATELDFRQNY